MKNILTAILFLSFAFGFGQDTSAPKEAAKLIKENATDVNTGSGYNQIFTSVDSIAVPPGGMNAFRQFIGSSFKVPEVNQTTMGRVVTKFTVCKDGSICDIQVVNESPAGLGLADEAKRILNISGNWKPAIKNEESVSTYYTLPIVIQITAIDPTEPANKENNTTPKKE
jgi:hypothetical protein